MMNAMMRETLLMGTAQKASLPGWQAAGKTGTSQDFRDAWFVGYTANLVTGVWLGNDDSSPTKKATGGGLPVEVWSRFMKAAHQGVPVAALPGLATTPSFASVASRRASAAPRLRSAARRPRPADRPRHGRLVPRPHSAGADTAHRAAADRPRHGRLVRSRRIFGRPAELGLAEREPSADTR